jgi:hypothetical protein
LAITYDGATLRLYVNGALVSSRAHSGVFATSTNPLRIGGNEFYEQFFGGLIDEVRVYNRPLSITEIQADMTTPVSAAGNTDTQAPSVSITSPTTAPTYSTTATSITLSGSASDNVGVTQVTWANTAGDGGTATGTTAWSAAVPLHPGTDTLIVTARDAAGNTARATLIVTVSGSTTKPGLVAAYGFNESSGSTVVDGSTLSNSGTIGSGVTRVVSGRFGGALSFNGNGMVTIPHTSSLALTNAMTLEAWVNPAQGAVSSAWRDVIYKGNDNYYLMATSANNALPAGGASFGNTSATVEAYATSRLAAGTWTHLAITYDGSRLRLYVNGSFVSSRARSGVFTTSTNPLRIGGNEFYEQFFQGLIDEVRVYNRPLSAAEIQSDMITPVGTATGGVPDAGPSSLSITSQPSSTAQSGVPFAQQPAVQLRDASNNSVTQSGVVVRVAIASGGGTLGGTTTATTNASGVASFTNLSITGTAGTRTLSFTSQGLTGVTSSSISITAGGTSTGGTSTGGSYPNRPASFTRSSEIDFSQAVPSQPDNVDRPISGTDWNMIYFGNNWTKTTDANAPQSAPGIWQGRWAAGSYGGGVLGQGSGHGIGNVFTYAPSGTNRLYMSLRVYFDFDASNWHPISNKFVNLEGDRSLILMQLMEGGEWRHAEELGSGGSSFFVDDGRDAPGEDHIAGQVDNRPVPNRQWTQIEILVDIPNHVYKIWQDGVLTTNASPNFASSRINAVGIYAFRGGGGETLNTDLYYRYDHFFVAW